MIKPQVDRWILRRPRGDWCSLRLVNPGCDWPPVVCHVQLLTNQVLAHRALREKRDAGVYKNDVYVLPKVWTKSRLSHQETRRSAQITTGTGRFTLVVPQKDLINRLTTAIKHYSLVGSD